MRHIAQRDSISIHALREEGDEYKANRHKTERTISIHALREEGDPIRKMLSPKSQSFLSTPSARRATRCILYKQDVICHFYPRPPRGGRRSLCAAASGCKKFLSTPSARRATIPVDGGACLDIDISIHALREEGDADFFTVL